uniref:SH3 domain-containing protein n=1 Tax=Macrostomum lignano TaxID=282301 RepID=A0A1I8HTN7_9PLAT
FLQQGVDPSLENSYGQTAKDAISRETPNSKELQHLLDERLLAVEAEAIRDYCDLADSSSIAFRLGERLTVLERGGGRHPNPAMWKGYVSKEGPSRAGYFPCSAVHVLPTATAGPEGRQTAKASASHAAAPAAPAAPPGAAAAANGLKGSVDSGLGPRQSVVSIGSATCSSGSSAGSLGGDDCASMLSSSSGLGGGAEPPAYRPDEWRRAGLCSERCSAPQAQLTTSI